MSDKTKYTALVKDLHSGLKDAAAEYAEMGIAIGEGELASELVPGVLYDETWVTKYLTGLGVTDVEGRLADDIYSGRG